MNTYRFEIREPEQDQSSLDQIVLTAVDHDPGVGVAVAPDGRLAKYRETIPPHSAFDRHGAEHVAKVNTRGGEKYEGYPGDELLLTFRVPRDGPLRFPIPPGVPVDLLLVVDKKETCGDPPCPGSIVVQVQYESGWRDVEVVHPRALWEDYVVDLAGEIAGVTDSLQIRLVWTKDHDIDFAAFLVPSRTVVDSTPLSLLQAVHASGGSVLDELSAADSVYAGILPGEKITLVFDDGPPTPEGWVRDFILMTRGYYLVGDNPLAARSFPTLLTNGNRVEPILEGPNPFRAGEVTRIEFSVPSARQLTLTIHDVAGRRVKTLATGIVPGGTQVYRWNGRDEADRPVEPGIYFSVLIAGEARQSRKLVVIK